MRAMLGVRCPECGTGDAPCISVVVGSDSVTNNADCPRCGRSRTGVNAYSALAAFYGPQEAGPLTVTTLEPALCTAYDYNLPESERATIYFYRCERFGIESQGCATEAEALAAWNKLVGGGR